MQEASQTGIAVNTHEFKNCYDEFVTFLLAQSATSRCKVAWLDTLDYTHVELASLTNEVSEKKCSKLCKKGRSLC